MNFISKNLWWILLFLFFLFMLFIISTNQKKEQELSNTGANMTQSGVANLEISEDNNELDSLIEKLSEPSDEDEEKNDTSSEENTSNTGVLDTTEGKKSSIFNFFRKESKDEGTDENDSDASFVEEEKDAWKMMDVTKNKESRTSDVVSEDPNAGLVKNTGKTTTKPIDNRFKHIGAIEFPGTDLESFIGKKYAIWVYSLKLNNAYFNETLAYMMEWDIVEQITKENAYGCFKVKISDSVISNNNGKQGYVCKKYLMDVVVPQETIEQGKSEKSSMETPVSIETPANYYTPNGQLYLQDERFSQKLTVMDDTEVLKQIGDKDINGCFKVRIVGSSEEHCTNVGLEGYVCEEDVSPYTK